MLKEIGFQNKAIVSFLIGKSKILKLKLKEYRLLQQEERKEGKICQLFLSYILETKKDFEKYFEISKDQRPLYSHLSKWIFDELRNFALIITDMLFKTNTIIELSIIYLFNY